MVRVRAGVIDVVGIIIVSLVEIRNCELSLLTDLQDKVDPGLHEHDPCPRPHFEMGSPMSEGVGREHIILGPHVVGKVLAAMSDAGHRHDLLVLCERR